MWLSDVIVFHTVHKFDVIYNLWYISHLVRCFTLRRVSLASLYDISADFHLSSVPNRSTRVDCGPPGYLPPRPVCTYVQFLGLFVCLFCLWFIPYHLSLISLFSFKSLCCNCRQCWGVRSARHVSFKTKSGINLASGCKWTFSKLGELILVHVLLVMYKYQPLFHTGSTF